MGLLFCEEFVKLGGNAVIVDINKEAAEKEARCICEYANHLKVDE